MDAAVVTQKNYLIRQGDLYWRPEKQGYTFRLWEAGLYTKDEATRMERYQRTPVDRAIPVTREHVAELERDLAAMQAGLDRLREALS